MSRFRLKDLHTNEALNLPQKCNAYVHDLFVFFLSTILVR